MTLGQFRPRMLLLGCALSAIALIGTPSTSQAIHVLAVDEIINAVGFELPDYDTTFAPGGGLPVGSLEGQGAVVGHGPWQVSPMLPDPPLGTAVVQSGVFAPGGGSQAVEVNKAAGADNRWGVPVAGWPTKRIVCIEWDMYVEDAGGDTVAGEFGPFFGVEAYDDVAVGGSDFGRMGFFGVDATTGEVLYEEDVLGHFTPIGMVNFNEWNNFRMDLDFDLKQYTVFLNDVPLITQNFVGDPDGNPLTNNGILFEQFSDAPIAALAVDGPGSPSDGLTGTAYFDNYRVIQFDAKIPEPSTWVLAFLACVALPRLIAKRSGSKRHA